MCLPRLQSWFALVSWVAQCLSLASAVFAVCTIYVPGGHHQLHQPVALLRLDDQGQSCLACIHILHQAWHAYTSYIRLAIDGTSWPPGLLLHAFDHMPDSRSWTCRFRCAACKQDFCGQCFATPYHAELTCEQHKAPKCLYCQTPLLHEPPLDTDRCSPATPPTSTPGVAVMRFTLCLHACE